MFKDFNFSLFGEKWKVKFVAKVPRLEGEPEEGFLQGRTCYPERIIFIATNEGTIKLDIHNIELTLLHEMFHVILTSGMYTTCSDDEPLVEWLAKCVKHLKDNKVLGLKS